MREIEANIPKTALLLTQRRYFLDPQEWGVNGTGVIADKLAALTRNTLYGSIPHVGIGIVASELSALGYAVEIGDLNNPADIEKAKHNSLVGVSFLDIASDRVVGLIESGKLYLKNTVFGGLGATCLEEKLRTKFPAISIVSGEAEGIMAAVVHDLEAGNLQPKYQRDTRVDMGTAIDMPYINPLHSFRSFRVFRDSLFQAIEVGRGCQYGCEFCITAGDKPRLKPLQVVLREITELRKGFGRCIIFVDQNLFAYPHDYLLELFKQVNKLGLFWAGEGSIVDGLVDKKSDVLRFNDELLRTMAEKSIGFLVGVEDLSGTVRGAAKMHILQTKFSEIAKALREYRLPVTYSLVFGTDEQFFPNVFTDTVETALRLGITVLPHIATPRAGTLWERRLSNDGRMPETFPSSHLNQRYHIVHTPKHMTQEEVLAGYTWVYEKIFQPGEIFKRWQKNVSECGPRYTFGLLALEINGLTGSLALNKKYSELTKRYSVQLRL